MSIEILLANFLVLFHAIIVGITVAGAIAIFTSRFRKFHKKDFFAITFFIFSFGQIISLIFTGGCIFTDWERQLRLSTDHNTNYSQTFLQQYLPFLSEWFIESVPILTLASVIGAPTQIYLTFNRRKSKDTNYDNR